MDPEEVKKHGLEGNSWSDVIPMPGKIDASRTRQNSGCLLLPILRARILGVRDHHRIPARASRIHRRRSVALRAQHGLSRCIDHGDQALDGAIVVIQVLGFHPSRVCRVSDSGDVGGPGPAVREVSSSAGHGHDLPPSQGPRIMPPRLLAWQAFGPIWGTPRARVEGDIRRGVSTHFRATLLITPVAELRPAVLVATSVGFGRR